MGMSFGLTGLPAFILLAVALMNPTGPAVPAGNVNCAISTGGGGCLTTTFPQGVTVSTFSCTSGFNPCFFGALPQFSIITCSTSDVPITNNPQHNNAQACLIIDSHVCYVFSPFYCSNSFDTYLTSGQRVTTAGASSSGGTICSSCATTAQTSSFIVFSDWTLILVGLTAMAAVAAISVFAIGLDPEAVHIIFMVTGLLAAWTILTAISGFGASSSFWGALDQTGLSMGTIFYAILSIVYFLGALKAISRGGA